MNKRISLIEVMRETNAPFRSGSILLSMCCIFSAQVYAQEVKSVSSEILQQSGEDAFWEAKVNCEGGFSSIVIRQKLKQDNWCIEGAQLPCQPTKLKMARSVCLNISSLDGAQKEAVKAVKAENQTSQLARAESLRRLEAEKAVQERRIARIKLEQEAKEKERIEQDRLALVTVLNEQQLVLQEERILLDREKQEVSQLEINLESRAMEIERQLLAIDQ